MKKNYYLNRMLPLLLFVLTFGYGFSQVQVNVVPSGGTAGNTNGTGADPISDHFESIRYQVVYTAAELTAAGLQPGMPITALAWDVTEAPGTLDNYTVRMGHTAATNSAAHDASPTMVVKNAFAYTPAVGMTDIVFDVNFVWDGVQNILIEICTGPANPYVSPYGGVTVKTGITNGSRHIQDDGAGSQCGEVTTDVNNNKPYVRLTFTTPPCAGTPTAGTAAASVGNACASVPFTVSLTGATLATGITYQWQSSPQGMNTFTNIAGATGTTYTVNNQTAATDYFCIVTCTNGGASDSTNILAVGQNSPSQCYCTPTAGASSTTYYLNNITSTGGITNVAYTAASYSAYSNAYTTASAIQLPGTNLNVSLAVTGGGTHYFHGWVDWNNDGDFSDAGEAVFATTGYVGTPYNSVIPVSAGQAPGDYRVRMASSFIGAVSSPCGPNAYGNFVDFKLVVGTPTACTGTPTTVNITPAGSVNACDGSLVQLNSSYTPVLSNNFTYQWYKDGSPIAGATNSSYTYAATLDANFELAVKCAGSPADSTISNTVSIVVTGPCNAPCTPTAGASSTSYYLSNITTTGAISNFVHTSSSYSAYQDNYSTTSCVQLPGSSVNVSMVASSGTNYFYCWVDWNHDGDFADAGETIWATTTYTGSYNGVIAIPASQMAGDYRVRMSNSWSPTVTSACGPSPYGNFVDFKLVVMQQTACSLPTGLSATASPDSLKLVWNWAQNVHPIQSFKIQYGMTGFPLGSGEIVPANGINFADTVHDASLMGSGVYQVYVQAVCTTDTSAYTGPFTVVMPLTNDLVCNQELLTLGETYTFNNAGPGATVSANESTIAPPATGAQTTTGWVNSTLNGTLWYSFVAPASGSVRINSTAIPYNGQAAVYSATNCADFNTFTLRAANDDAIGGTSLAPNFTVCSLTPGATYYIMYDKFDATSGNFSLKVSPIVLEAGTADSVTNICSGEVLDLATTINLNSYGGTWSSPIPSVNASITDSTFNSNGLAFSTFNFEYRVVDGCAYDSIISQVKIFAPSNAGMDGTIAACKNEPIDLLAGLNGNADLNGQWYDPSNVSMPNSQITTGGFPGQFNYDYISGNGVCPNDTANVVVTVSSTCNWLSIEEMAFLEEVKLYPNPSTGIVFIESTFANGNFNLSVTDINGRTIQSGSEIISGTNTVNLKEVERGVYFFKLSTENAEKVFRVVIQ
ncbi:T9SS type A sorting domain-containing protein [Fluviicola taffensis]|uniref:Uncharacterized protein n=1 Tax=Fluviicola taffensis (strain DSM 16823 / NCIMB 13979 / RW262) TaxID=755732 RepID=F2IKA2_FLUTR|nr:T9SS type A sorting domain-containing protein [Fluviicola taffensis]AEA44005.1 hypothetical protein Fluta_2019 [Fluviicola taffensis DSM 16823]